MSNYTKEQIENNLLSAKDLLASWTSGQGATGKEPGKFAHVKDGAINNMPVSISLLTALVEMYLVKSKASDKFYEAVGLGYLSPNHLDQYKESATVKQPLSGHYMTAAQWEQSCIDKLPPLPEPDYIGAMSLILTIKEAMTKAEQWAIIQQAIALVNVLVYSINDCTQEQQDKFYDLLGKETAIMKATSALSVYLDNIKPVSTADNMVQGKYSVLSGNMPAFKQVLADNSWTIVLSTAIDAGESILFTIKVI